MAVRPVHGRRRGARPVPPQGERARPPQRDGAQDRGEGWGEQCPRSLRLTGEVRPPDGGTGFLGTALVEKMLRSLPSLGRLYLIVRPSRTQGRGRGSRRTSWAPPPSRLCATSSGRGSRTTPPRRSACWRATCTPRTWGSGRKTSPSSRGRWTS
ncbi:hypothetical protein GBA65_05915 [Rubrobacter marinus]|uniref:Thioester reductase (TE) domain-containing protein n=1 Tax=Rubrobacter marinus TaxID=2653852 RepID=A0A6G8PV87_9ACTN|nr:hypothetical protein GBA65_05915 [Rubrobacter marinus]